jgi:membrane associated rhomboid family serine protease
MYLSANRILIWSCAVCYMLQSIYFPGFDLSYGLSYIGNQNFYVIQLVSHSFLHGDPFHLLINMFMLVLFGLKIEMVFGKIQFFTLYFLSVIGGATFQTISNMIIIYNHFGNPFPLDSTTTIVGNTLFALENGQYIKSVFSSITIGASGGIFGCMVAFTLLFPKERFQLILLPLSVSSRWFVVVYLMIEIYHGFIVENQSVNIAHFAHLGGATFGFIYAQFLKLKYNI